ncbi:hypothetical protein [Stenotrophomonas maltophilia group sp. CASM26]|uniref:hypothetical protein n=1 Tax=Stenotrophomonas TaxID=40323 RepID=UPI003BF7B01E
MSNSTNIISEALTEAEGNTVAVASSENRQRLAELTEQLLHASGRKRAVLSKVETMRRAGEVAKSDAATARQQWSAQLRDGDGTLTRSIQKLRVTERSALSLAEEYEALAKEVASPLPRLDLELAEIASTCMTYRDGVIKEVAAQVYQEVLAQAGDHLAVALGLFAKAESAGIHHRQQASDDDLAARFFHRLSIDVRQCVDSLKVREHIQQQLALPALDLGVVDMKLATSPSTRSIRARELNEGPAQ